jgi:glycosyltransferase involved in cell wall biosynthesis
MQERRVKVAIVSTHPIQYYAPVFRILASSERVHPRVFYTWSQSESGNVFDPGFKSNRKWDIPLLDGYEFEFVPNLAKNPGTHHFSGIDNPSLHQRIAEWGAQAVLVYAWNLKTHLQALRYFHGKIPVFFRGDSTLLNRNSRLRSAARHLFLRWVYRHVDVAVAVGSNNRDYFDWCGIPQERIRWAPHSIDNNRFDDVRGEYEQQAAQWRRELSVAAEDTVIVFAGKFIREKNVDLLLQAFLAIDSKAHLVLFGNGPLEEQLRSMAGGHARVHFMPFQNQSLMPSVYRLGDILILPSRSETWGLAVNEAMACKRAVIVSSQVGAARDLVQHGVNGWVFQAEQLPDLTRVLAEALRTPGHKVRSMGECAYKLIQSWSAEESASKIAEVVSGYVESSRSHGRRLMATSEMAASE